MSNSFLFRKLVCQGPESGSFEVLVDGRVVFTVWDFDYDDDTAGSEIRDGISIRCIKDSLDPLGLEYRISSHAGFIATDYVEPSTLDVVIPNTKINIHAVSGAINISETGDEVDEYIDVSSVSVRIPSDRPFWVVELRAEDGERAARAILEQMYPSAFAST